MKKLWSNPLLNVYKMSGGGAGDVTGEGSADSTPDAVPFDYENWCIEYADFPEIMNFDGVGDSGTWADYRAWMIANNFGDPGETQP